jgi:hypothetical protein
MEQCSSWEATCRSAIEEICRLLWNLNVDHSVYKSPPLVPTVNQMNYFHTLRPFFFNVISISPRFSPGCPLPTPFEIDRSVSLSLTKLYPLG